MDLTKLIRFNGNKLASVLDRLAVLEDRANDEHNEFVHECLRKRRKRTRIETEKGEKNAKCE